jgi:hypothetical protein
MPVHYIPRKLGEIKERDFFVSLIGKILKAGENSFILSDGENKLEIVSEEKVEEGKFVRVFCSRIGGLWRADLIQDLSKLDLEMFKHAEEAYRKAVEKTLNI